MMSMLERLLCLLLLLLLQIHTAGSFQPELALRTSFNLCVCVCVQEAACAYVIALVAVYWCTEVLPLAVTALLPTILFPVLGIMESKDVRVNTHTRVCRICQIEVNYPNDTTRNYSQQVFSESQTHSFSASVEVFFSEYDRFFYLLLLIWEPNVGYIGTYLESVLQSLQGFSIF